MATKPTIKTVNASAMDILNVIRANASSTYLVSGVVLIIIVL